MPYTLFHRHFPQIAARETRTFTVLPGSDLGLPPDQYAFLEMFCDEVGCDCRRVFFQVMSSRRQDVVAVVTYGWEPPAFYAKWLKDDDPAIVALLKGPSLNIGSPESDLSPAVLDLVRNILLRDPAYVERVKRHYRMFREKIDGAKTTKKRKARR